jgi:Ca2+-binding RTX toxin-like protein
VTVQIKGEDGYVTTVNLGSAVGPSIPGGGFIRIYENGEWARVLSNGNVTHTGTWTGGTTGPNGVNDWGLGDDTADPILVTLNVGNLSADALIANYDSYNDAVGKNTVSTVDDIISKPAWTGSTLHQSLPNGLAGLVNNTTFNGQIFSQAYILAALGLTAAGAASPPASVPDTHDLEIFARVYTTAASIDTNTATDWVAGYQTDTAGALNNLAGTTGDPNPLDSIDSLDPNQDSATRTLLKGQEILQASGATTLNGGAGNDFLYGDATANTINGDGHDDFIYGSDGNDRLFGGAGGDLIVDGHGKDYLVGGSGNDVIIADETLGTIGGTADTSPNPGDVLVGGAHASTALIVTDSDIIFAGSGNDILFGDSVNLGNPADPYASAQSLAVGSIGTGGGNDTISAGAGDDRVYGQGGADVIEGGLGVDTMYGGTGSDIYYYRDVAEGSSSETIYFGENASTDKLDVSDILVGYDVGEEADYINVNFSGAGPTTYQATVQVDIDGAGGPASWQTIAVVMDSPTNNEATFVQDNMQLS